MARKSRRSTINADDINQAFRHLNVEPVYGISNTSDPFRFVKLSGHAQVMRVSDPVVPVDAVLETPLPLPPWEAGVRIHWLAIDGRQPNVPENVQMLKPTRKPKRRKTDILAPEPGEEEKRSGEADDQKEGGGASDNPGGVLVKAPLKHVLSRELNLYLDRAMGVLEGGSGSRSCEKNGQGVVESGVDTNWADSKRLLDATLASLRLDAGIQPLAPYLCHTLAQNIWSELAGEGNDHEGEENEEVGNEDDDARGNRKKPRSYDPAKLNAYLRASECIASNRTLDLSWYLHELIPAVVDVILEVPAESNSNYNVGSAREHRLEELKRKYRWDQREYAAKAIASICVWYPEVAPRVQKQFVQSLRASPETHIPAIYGAIVGIARQGERAIQTLLLPNLLPLVRNLSTHAKSCSVRELDIVRDVLLSTAGSLLRERLAAERPLPPVLEVKRFRSHRNGAANQVRDVAAGEDVAANGTDHHEDEPLNLTRTKSTRSQKATKTNKARKGSKAGKRSASMNLANLDDFFASDEEGVDSSIMFPQDSKSIAASAAWLKKYCKANKTAMEPVSGSGEGRYHAATLYKNAAGESEVKHQMTATYKTGSYQLEVFPANALAQDAKILQKAYAEDPRPDEYQRLVHNVFGAQSDPYCVYESQFLL